MSLTQDEHIILDRTSDDFNKDKSKYYPFQDETEHKTVFKIQINEKNPFLEQDLTTIIYWFEKSCQNWSEEDYAKAYLYRDVYATYNFSTRVREQMDYYPGMHQTDSPR
jgi:hypothetical protein